MAIEGSEFEVSVGSQQLKNTGTLWSNMKWLWFLCFLLCLVSSSGKDCSQWPSLASYNLVDKQFTCDGSITNFMLCNRRRNTFLGLSLRKNASGTLDVRVQEAHVMLKHRLIFSGGDQLMFTVIYYPSGGTNTVDTVSGCIVPLAVTTGEGCNCSEWPKPTLCLIVTHDCFQSIPMRELLGDPQTSQPVCADTSTTFDTSFGTSEVTETQLSTMTREYILTGSHLVAATAAHAIPSVSSQSCADHLPSNTNSIRDAFQASNPTISPGAAVGIVLGVVLIVQTIACTVAWLLCFKRKKGRMEREGTDVAICVEAKTAQNTAELYASASVNAANKYEMTTKGPSIDSLPESQKSSHGYYSITFATEEYAVLQGDYDGKEDSYWTPAATLNGIKAQMREKNIHSFELQPESITLQKELGKGEFGMVHKGEWAGSPQGPLQVAVKSLHRQEEESRYKLLKEAAIMGQFNHPYVVRLYGVIDKPNKVMLIMEYLSRGDLFNHLIKSRTAPVQEDFPLQLLKFCQEIADAMEYLSKRGFIHRDLAARNILLNEEYTAKIADFGMSHDMDEDYYYKPKGGMIPVKWTAPEAILYRKYTTKSDVWSYGMVMYEIWSLGHKPFEEFNINQVLRAFETRYCQPPPPGCPRNIYNLMVGCWNPDHHSRSTFEDLTSELARGPEALLRWKEQDKTASPKAVVLGAPLEEGRHLYQELQEKYK